MQIMVAMANHLSMMFDELDSLLLRASIKDPRASISSMKEHIVTPLNALDNFLKIGLADVFKKG